MTDAGTAATSSPEASTPEAVHRLDLLRTMLLIRRFEETCAELYSSARIRGFVHLYVGEEAVATGVMSALGPEDAVVSTYREHGHALAHGLPVDALMAEMFGKQTGCSGGRGGSMHLFDRERHFVGGNAVVAAGLPLAIGLALGDKMQGRDRVTVCFFGEGAAAEGEFHETLNLAALWKLPVLFCCENNLYAMGTSIAKEHAQPEIALRAESYGMAAWPVDGMDVFAVETAARRAVEAIRGGAGPHLLELRTFRFRAHSMYDPDRYREKAEVDHWKHQDPIETLVTTMRAARQVDDAGLAAVQDEVAALVAAAVDAADLAPYEPVETLTRFVTSENGAGGGSR